MFGSIPRAVALLPTLSHSLTISIFLCLASTASAPYPLSFSESKGRGHQTMVPGFHLSAVILCAYTMLAAVESSSSSEQLYCEFNLKMSHPAREEVMINLLTQLKCACVLYVIMLHVSCMCPTDAQVRYISCRAHSLIVVQYPPPLMPT